MTKTVTYVAVLADAVGSRTLPPKQRAALQERLRTALRTQVNRRRQWQPHLAAGFAISRGDELEGLLRDPAIVWDFAHWLRAAFAEVDWTIACARGPISTALAPTAPEVDGPCFHDARAALDAAKKRRQVFTFRGFAPTVDALAGYYSALYWSWTPRQRRQAAALRLDAAAAPQVAASHRVHPTAISHLKRRMAWPLVAEGDSMLRAALGTPGEGR